MQNPPPGALLSPDGRWWWDGTAWRPAPPPPAPGGDRPSWLPAEAAIPTARAFEAPAAPVAARAAMQVSPGPRASGISAKVYLAAGLTAILVIGAIAFVTVGSRPRGGSGVAATGGASPACPKLPNVTSLTFHCLYGSITASGDITINNDFQTTYGGEQWNVSCGEYGAGGSRQHVYYVPPGDFPEYVSGGRKISLNALLDPYRGPGTYTLKDLVGVDLYVDDRYYNIHVSSPNAGATVTTNPDGSGSFKMKTFRWVDYKEVAELDVSTVWRCSEIPPKT